MTAIATTNPDACPDCGEPLDTYSAEQPALFKFGGFGATERTTVAHCRCGFLLTKERTEIKPQKGN